jgi:hypothetical protein
VFNGWEGRVERQRACEDVRPLRSARLAGALVRWWWESRAMGAILRPRLRCGSGDVV